MTTAADATALERTAGQPETGRRRWAVLAVVSAAQFLTILDLWVVNIALPALQHDFAPATLSDVSWILDVYAIVLAALLLPAGRAADSIGRRALLPGRPRGVRRRVAGMRGGPGSAGADRLPGAAGGRGRGAACRPHWGSRCRCSRHASGAPRSGYGRGSARWPLAAARCSAACWSSRAGAGSSSSTCPSSVATLAAGVAILPRRRGAAATAAAVRLAHRRGRGRPGAGRGGAGVHGADRGTGMAAVAHLAGAGRRAGPGGRVRGPHPPSPRPPGLAPALCRPRVSAPAPPGSSPTTRALRPCSWARRCCSPCSGTSRSCRPPSASRPAPSRPGSFRLSPGGCRPASGCGPRSWRARCFSRRPGPGRWPAPEAAPGLCGGRAAQRCCCGAWPTRLIQPSLFAAADAAPRAELASGSAVLATARQLGPALGVAIFVAVLGGHPAAAWPDSTVPGSLS